MSAARRGGVRRLGTPLLLLAACFSPAACSRYGGGPTMVVEPRPFAVRVTAEGVLAAATATRIGVPTDLDEVVRLAWLAPEGVTVAAGEVVARFDPVGMERLLDEGRSELDSATVEARKTAFENEVTLSRLDTRRAAAGLELDLAERFQKVDEVLFSRHDIVESAIDRELAVDRQDNANATRTTQSELGATRLDLVAIKQRKARLKVDRARSTLEALEVRAPHAGLLTLLRDWRGEAFQVGSQIWPGQEIAEIPDLSTLQAEVYVLEADAGGLEVGKPAELLVEARPDVTHAATISRVDPVAKPRTRGSPVQYFGVTLALERADPSVMKPGQRVRATLVLEELEQAVVVPRQAVLQENGSSRVLVRRGGQLERRTVTLGPASAGLVVVASGLEAGETVALNPTSGHGPEAVDRPNAAAVEGD